MVAHYKMKTVQVKDLQKGNIIVIECGKHGSKCGKIIEISTDKGRRKYNSQGQEINKYCLALMDKEGNKYETLCPAYIQVPLLDDYE